MLRRKEPAMTVAAIEAVANTGALREPDATARRPQHTERQVHIHSDLWIGPLPYRETFLDACEPVGRNTIRPIRQFTSNFAFIRRLSVDDLRSASFDPQHRLGLCIQLSRLVRPHPTGYLYSARIVRRHGRRREIVPSRRQGLGARAYTIDGDDNWFGDDDVAQLRRLLEAFKPVALSDRIKRAIYYHEYLFWTQLVDMRLPNCVTALESLVHTRGGRMKATNQFVTRLAKLRQFVPELRWSEADLRSIYDLRSGVAHGVGLGADALSRKAKRLYLLAEGGLRQVLVSAICRPEIADIFASDGTIRSYLGFE